MAKLGLINYRLTITDEIIDRLGREYNSIQTNPQNFTPDSKNPRKAKIKRDAFLRLDQISREVEILFHVLVVNLYSLNEVIDQVETQNNPTAKKVHKALRPCLRALKSKRKLINDWRSNVTAHGKLWGKPIRGPTNITHRPQKFQKTVYLLTKYASMYGSAMNSNLIAERAKASRKIKFAWKAEAIFENKDYYQQLKRAKQVRKIVLDNLKTERLTPESVFVKCQ